MNLRVPGVSEMTKTAAPNRKKESGKSAKKNKYAVEERKPTEEDLWFDDVDPADIEATSRCRVNIHSSKTQRPP